ncbi:MAG: anaerobic sulfatase maturase [Desulfobacteraceae bacterium]|nr:anaerobic sulfatase maturase [Desulfobacteraceae bacterium]
MAQIAFPFQVFVKPAGNRCHLSCDYCYYAGYKGPYLEIRHQHMAPELLERYIQQHIAAHPGPVVPFSWHGGEPTLLGVDFFRTVVALQKKYGPSGIRITNGIQTNGTLIDHDWCTFLKKHHFTVGISLDGPAEIHDHYRKTVHGNSTFEQVMRGYFLLQRYHIPVDILCVVNDLNVMYPLQVYQFFREIRAAYIGFLPLVEPGEPGGETVSVRSVGAEELGAFLCLIFDQWQTHDIGKIRIQIFEEAASTAFGLDHALCIFRETCGEIPMIEHNGDVYSCDHFFKPENKLGNLMQASLAELIASSGQMRFGAGKKASLPLQCRKCTVLNMCNGGCPKDRLLTSSDGRKLNYLCDGYTLFFNHCKPFVKELSTRSAR